MTTYKVTGTWETGNGCEEWTDTAIFNAESEAEAAGLFRAQFGEEELETLVDVEAEDLGALFHLRCMTPGVDWELCEAAMDAICGDSEVVAFRYGSQRYLAVARYEGEDLAEVEIQDLV